MKKLEQRRNAGGQVFPSPRVNEVMYETPPTFCFLYEGGAASYTVSIRQNGCLVWQGSTSRNYLTPDRVLASGSYEWNLSTTEAERGWQPFSIAEEAVVFLRPDAKKLLASIPDTRPRHLFCREDLPEIRHSHQQALETLQRNTTLALQHGLPEAPRYHRSSDALPYREYFGRHRDYCDRDLIACALGHQLLGHKQAGQHARELLLTLCDWSSEGPCSLEGPWGDEVGLSHARCLPAAFDLCHDLLNEKERLFVARTVAAYAFQCERRLSRIDFCQNPGDSHAGRLPAYLGEAALVLKGTDVADDDVLQRWLNFAIDVYGGIFPYYGGPDGGWAEGVFYASSYTKWYLPFFSAVERFSGISFLKRPFYQRLIRYFQHFCPPGWEIHPFSDGYWCKPDDDEWPGFFAQNPYHIYAERFGCSTMKEWSKQAQQQQIFKLHLLDVFLPDGPHEENSLAGGLSRASAFPDAGLLSLHTDPHHPANELALLARASRHGSMSHQHADQGSFALIAGGTALISPSGYFGRQYGTKHHRKWTNQSRAHNTLLIDGIGQPSFSYEATGRILYAHEDADGVLRGAVDPSQAYQGIVQSWIRTFELTDDQLVVVDEIRLNKPARIDYLLHSLSEPQFAQNGLTLERNNWRLDILPQSGSLSNPVISNRFDVDVNEGEPAAYHVSMPKQYHMRWQTPVSPNHSIRVVYKVTRIAKE